jgi:hypothetical protein
MVDGADSKMRRQTTDSCYNTVDKYAFELKAGIFDSIVWAVFLRFLSLRRLPKGFLMNY